MISLTQLLKVMLENKASDMHISTGAPPSFRVNGVVSRAQIDPLTPAETKELCCSVLTESQKAFLEEHRQIDLSFGIRDLARFRANIFYQRGTISGAFRHIPFKIPKLNMLGLPATVNSLINKSKGLILVTGSTGSGKTTTLASIINELSTNKRLHIITIEDPIEFIHSHGKSLVNQREIGTDAFNYAEAVRAALREDPDVVMIGEMRDRETIETALTLAETGHLVFSTLHTNSAPQTVNRIVQVFPKEQQDQVRMQLSLLLEGILSQSLIERHDVHGRVLALELMIATSSIRNLIRENKIFQIQSAMRMGQDQTGMVTMNQSLSEMVSKNWISIETALDYSPEPDELIRLIGNLDRNVG